MVEKKPENLTKIVGVPHTPIVVIPYTPSVINDNEKISLDFVLRTKKGPVLCDYYASIMSTHPIGQMMALLYYAHETNQEVIVEGRLVEKIIGNTGDSTRDRRSCCMNIYQITFPDFGTYMPPELHSSLEKKINGSQ